MLALAHVLKVKSYFEDPLKQRQLASDFKSSCWFSQPEVLLMARKMFRYPIYAGLGLGCYGVFQFYKTFMSPIDKLSRPPADSLLERLYYQPSNFGRKYGPIWSDCYQCTRVVSLGSNQWDIGEEELSGLVAKAFFTSPAFAVERYILSTAGLWTHSAQQVLQSSFHVGERFGIFRVVAKTNGQILFQWENEQNIVGGSFISVAVSKKDGCDAMECTLRFGSEMTEPRQRPLLWILTTPIHALYTRVLLKYTMDSFLDLMNP